MYGYSSPFSRQVLSVDTGCLCRSGFVLKAGMCSTSGGMCVGTRTLEHEIQWVAGFHKPADSQASAWRSAPGHTVRTVASIRSRCTPGLRMLQPARGQGQDGSSVLLTLQESRSSASLACELRVNKELGCYLGLQLQDEQPIKQLNKTGPGTVRSMTGTHKLGTTER